MNKKVYDQYADLGFILLESDKNKTPLRPRKIDGVCGAEKSFTFHPDLKYLVVPPSDVLIIDVDIKDGKVGMDSLAKLENDLWLEPDELKNQTAVITGSGGLHIYARLYDGFLPLSLQDNYPDIDFNAHRLDKDKCPRYAMAGGQTIQFKGKEYVYELKDLSIVEGLTLHDVLNVDVKLVKKEEEPTTNALGFTNLEGGKVASAYDKKTEEEVRNALQYVTANSYEEWYPMVTVIQEELGEGKKAFEVFRWWSEKYAGGEYNPDDCREKWDNIGTTDTPRTFGTVLFNAREGKAKQYIDKINKIEKMDKVAEIFLDPEWLAFPSLDDKNLNEVAVAYSERNKELTGARRSVAKALTAIEIGIKGEEEYTPEEGEFDWLDKIAYVESFNPHFYDISTNERFSEIALNGRYHAKLRTMGKKMQIKGALTLNRLLSMGRIIVCSAHSYNPTKEERIYIDEEGKTTLNTFKVESIPPVAEYYTEEGKDLVDKFVQHFFNIMAKEEAVTLLNWLAYQAQNRGSKIIWTPLVQSNEGLGKSLIGSTFINHVIGKANGRIVDASTVNSPQTGWSSGTSFIVMEEIRVQGHNRYEVVDKLKTIITNPTVMRIEKYESSVEVDNFANLIAFTNFTDALPLKNTDRRWWIVYSRQHSLPDLEKEMGMDRHTYYTPLQKLVNIRCEFGPEIHKYFMDYKISSTFSPNFPPESLHKDTMLATEDSKVQYLTEVKYLIELNMRGVNEDVISTRELKALMATEAWDEEDYPTDNALASILRRLDYKSFSKKIVYGGVGHRIWFKKPTWTEPEIRESFNKAMKQKNNDLKLQGMRDLEEGY